MRNNTTYLIVLLLLLSTSINNYISIIHVYNNVAISLSINVFVIFHCIECQISFRYSYISIVKNQILFFNLLSLFCSLRIYAQNTRYIKQQPVHCFMCNQFQDLLYIQEMNPAITFSKLSQDHDNKIETKCEFFLRIMCREPNTLQCNHHWQAQCVITMAHLHDRH